jgi:hypothetical protein
MTLHNAEDVRGLADQMSRALFALAVQYDRKLRAERGKSTPQTDAYLDAAKYALRCWDAARNDGTGAGDER